MSIEVIKSLIHVVRGQRVILDSDLADLYQVETKVLNQMVTRNRDRFPDDFMFRLSAEEWSNLKSQFVTSSLHGGRRKRIRQLMAPPARSRRKIGYQPDD